MFKNFVFCSFVSLFVIALPANTKAQLPVLVTGADAGGTPLVKAFFNSTARDSVFCAFLPYAHSFTGGVRVATGDVNGDGRADIITAPGPGMGPHLRIFDGHTCRQMRGPTGDLWAYRANFTGGVNVAAGDVNGDGRADIITGPGPGAPPRVQVFDGFTHNLIHSFLAYGPGFLGGVNVAAGDVNGDGIAEVVTGAGPGGGPHVKVFDLVGMSQLSSFFAYDPGFQGGVFVAAGDVNNDGFADVITGAGAGGGPHVKAFDGLSNTVMLSFFAFSPGFTGGVRVAVGDVNGDGTADIIAGAGPGASAQVRAFNPLDQSVLLSFLAYPNSMNGLFVAEVQP